MKLPFQLLLTRKIMCYNDLSVLFYLTKFCIKFSIQNGGYEDSGNYPDEREIGK